MTKHPLFPAMIAALALGAAAPAVWAQSEDATAAVTEAATDATAFATMAASANMFEIESSKLALEKTRNEEIRAFAQKMIDDHTAAAEKFKAAAEAEGITAPSGMNETDTAALEALTGSADFDQAYLAAQVTAHDTAVALFEGFSTKGPEGALRDFAAATLPTLQDHQKQVKALSGK